MSLEEREEMRSRRVVDWMWRGFFKGGDEKEEGFRLNRISLQQNLVTQSVTAST